ncbi:MAG: urease accessory protein UreE [Candidatus Thiodiazotropha sp.]
MIRLTETIPESGHIDARLTLPLESRTRSRLRVVLDDGREAGLFLPRGATLRHGDLLRSDEGLVVRVQAAPETLSQVVCDDPLLLARACYHLGNRHVALQIEPGRLSYLHDHVLDAMVAGLGLTVTLAQAPFEPEAGAYGSHGHDSAHRHAHG